MEIDLIIKLLGLCLLSSILELDTSFIGQFQLSRPIVVGTIFGILTGNILHGLQMGIFVEFLLLDFVQVGAFTVPSGNVAITCCLLMQWLYGLSPQYAFPISILCGWAYAYMDKYIRIAHSNRHKLTEQNIINNLDVMKGWLLKNMFINLASTFLFVLLTTLIVGKISKLIFPFVPESVNIALIFSYIIIPWIGAGRLLTNFGHNLFNGKQNG